MCSLAMTRDQTVIKHSSQKFETVNHRWFNAQTEQTEIIICRTFVKQILMSGH